MTPEEIISLYEEYSKTGLGNRWRFVNGVIYGMCSTNPENNNEDIVAGKLLIIGRSYAAAVERRDVMDGLSNDDFYYQKAAPAVMCIEGLDDSISLINVSCEDDEEMDEKVLKIHKSLVDALRGITKQAKRSLASKYLHFHCPDKVFIYDSIAQKGINKLIKGKRYNMPQCSEYDAEYSKYYYKMKALQGILKKSCRELDGFVLWVGSKNSPL